MPQLPDSAEAARETHNLGIFQALGADRESFAMLELGKALGMSDTGALGRVYADAETGEVRVTIVTDEKEYDIVLTDGQAAAFVGAATTPSK